MKISFFAGPSGGHLFPALAFAEAFRALHPQSTLHLLTGRRGASITSRFPSGVFNEILYLPDFPLPSGISLRTFSFLLKLPAAFIISSRYLSKTKPDLCVGFGSYVSYPGLRLAAARGIPTLIHEQNFVPGRATRALAGCVDCVCVSFEETLAEMRLKRREVTGLPIRSALRPLTPPLSPLGRGQGEGNNPFRILILGGSQGARSLNQKIFDAFSRLLPEEKENLAVIHITGRLDAEKAEQHYQKIAIPHKIFPFYEAMQELYPQTDLAITRAGANTLFELALFGIPAVVIPYPFAGAHQAANAAAFDRRGAVIARREEEVTAEWLTAEIRRLRDDVDARLDLAKKIHELVSVDSAERLVEIAESLITKSTEPSPHAPSLSLPLHPAGGGAGWGERAG